MTRATRARVVLATDHPGPRVDIENAVLGSVGARLVVAASETELLQLAPQAEGILTCFGRVSPEVVKAAKLLEVIGRYGVGVDNIAVQTATECDVIVANVPEYCVDEAAEHALALLLTLARRIHRYDRAIREGNWALATGMPIHRLRGQTLGIVGLGRIGRALAARAQALGMKVMAAHHFNSDATSSLDVIERVSLDELFAMADFISLHVPLSRETQQLVGAKLIGLMKPKAVIINTSRGAVVDMAALEDALRSGRIGGAGLDVFDPERLSADHPLFELDNLVATPHVAFYSEESIGDLQRLAATNVAEVFSGRRPASIVNPSVLQRPRWAHLDARKTNLHF